jgi:hypothetical protein
MSDENLFFISVYPYGPFLNISRSKLRAFGNDSSTDFQKEIDSDLGEKPGV